MSENETLKFYVVDEEYIEYLSEFDSHVSWNKQQKRPYIGIVLKVGNYLYFAPLYSYKAGYDKYKENPSFMRIKNRKGQNVSIIRFAEMIPVPNDAIKLLDFTARGNKYKDLLQAESDFINDNKKIVYEKAKKIYRNVTKIKIPFFISIACNFELLEQKSKIYNNTEINKETTFIKDIEITCEVFDELNTIINTLENNGFKYVEEFTLDDIYMENIETNQFSPKGNKITDTLIIRYVNEDDKKIICKKRQHNAEGFEISTDKTILKIKDIENAEKLLNMLGYKRFLRMKDKNYMYENNNYIAYIQDVENLGMFLELESKNNNAMELVNYVQSLDLKIGKKFDIRKAELLYKKRNIVRIISKINQKS